MGVTYSYKTMLDVMEVLLKQPDYCDYIESIKYHLQSLLNRIDEENRKTYKDQLFYVMSLAKKKGIGVKDPNELTFWKLIFGVLALPFVMLYNLISWLVKVSGTVIVWVIILGVVVIAYSFFGFKGAAIAFFIMGGIFANKI